MNLQELLTEREKLVRQRLCRLRSSNPYKRLTVKIADVDRYIGLLRRQQKHLDKVALQAKIRSMTNG